MRHYRSLGSLRPRSGVGRAFSRALAGLFVLFAAFVALFYFGPVYSLTAYAPDQPIPYSHKLHAGELAIPCQYCHAYARRSEMAGVPSVAKCMNCHENITSGTEPIAKLKDHFERRTPIAWARVYDLPDHVWFSHKRHVAKNIECRRCHGAVETLEVNARVNDFKMGFCLDCHQAEGAPTDCWTCHT